MQKNLFLCRQKKCSSCFTDGVLSIEAALILPLFLVLMIDLCSVIGFMYINMTVDTVVYEEAKNNAMHRHDNTADTFDAVCVKVKDALGTSVTGLGLIKGGEAGLDFSDSDFTDNEIIKLCVKYDVEVPFDIINVMDLTFESKCVMHTYTGFTNGLSGYIDDSSYVYVTAGSSVYHTTRECTHIKLDIKSVNPSQIADLRNVYGEKYKRCKTCKASLNKGKVYITSSGDKYHSSFSCSGLKRTITRIKISETGDRRPCSRCGY